MMGLIDAIITVLPVLTVVAIFLTIPISFVALLALKIAHRVEIRRIRDIQGRHIRR